MEYDAALDRVFRLGGFWLQRQRNCPIREGLAWRICDIDASQEVVTCESIEVEHVQSDFVGLVRVHIAGWKRHIFIPGGVRTTVAKLLGLSNHLVVQVQHAKRVDRVAEKVLVRVQADRLLDDDVACGLPKCSDPRIEEVVRERLYEIFARDPPTMRLELYGSRTYNLTENP
jgi:hypothetical protein